MGKTTKEYRVRKALTNIEYGINILNNDYVSHFTEPSLDEINKSYEFIKKEMQIVIDRNFGYQKRNI